jgi:hypothetical protein
MHQEAAEEGYNISTVSLLMVRGDEREDNARGYNWDTLFLGDTNTEGLAPRLGESHMRQ